MSTDLACQTEQMFSLKSLTLTHATSVCVHITLNNFHYLFILTSFVGSLITIIIIIIIMIKTIIAIMITKQTGS